MRNNSSTEKRSPVYKTFSEAKQQAPGITDDYSTAPVAVNPNTITTKAVISSQMLVATSSVASNGSSGGGSSSTNPMYYPDMENVNYADETVISSDNYTISAYDEQHQVVGRVPAAFDASEAAAAAIHGFDDVPLGSGGGGGGNYPGDTQSFYSSDDFARPQSFRRMRRKSRELPEPPIQKLNLQLNIHQSHPQMTQPLASSTLPQQSAPQLVSNAGKQAEGAVPKTYNEDKRKPETMRSISEETTAKSAKPTTRRSMSHPEKPETTPVAELQPKPEPERKLTFAEILAEKKRQQQQTKKRNFKSSDSSLSPGELLTYF